MNAYYPEREFNGLEGQKSIETMGPEVLSKDLDALGKMFNPDAVHDDGSQGGISPENLNFPLDADIIGIEQIEGLVSTTVQGAIGEVFSAVTKEIADRRTAVSDEAASRVNKDDDLQRQITEEERVRAAAVLALQQEAALKNALLIAGENITITDNGDGTQTIAFREFDMFIVVSRLPAVGLPNRIYFVPAAGGQSFTEYIYVIDPDTQRGQWEDFGSITVDLGNYYTKAQTDELIRNLDCGSWDAHDAAAAVAAHNEDPGAHENMDTSGDDIDDLIDAHNDDSSAHGNLETDGGEI
jgi:hypothetical protein